MTATRTLLVLRHAHARPALPGQQDFDRELSPEGLGRAARLGQTLQERALVPDLVLCSAATRTRQTVEAMQLTASRTEFLPALYSASRPDIEQIVAENGDDAQTLMVVGHNPAIHGFAYDLSRHGSNATLFAAIGRAYPPATLSIFAIDGDWNRSPHLRSRLREML